MTATISDAIRDAGREMSILGEQDFAARLNATLGDLLSGFYVGPGIMVHDDGTRSAPFSCVIATARPDVGGMIPADAVACVAYLGTSLDRAALREAYGRIAQMRRLRKTPSPEASQTTITLGVVVAADSSLSLDEAATEMRSLNSEVTDGERPDMLAVLTKGTVHYGASFPGSDSVMGFLPPVQGGNVVPPINVMQLVTNTATHALNKLCGFIIGHARFYAPGIVGPDMKAATAGSPETTAIVWQYRFDVEGKMRDAVQSPPPTAPAYRIEDTQGRLLSRVLYQPWQDGGVVVAEGPLPLEGLLVLAGRAFPSTVFPLKNGNRASGVLPIHDQIFVEMMSEIAKRSVGMTVRQEPPQFTIAPLLDEGTMSPFAARLYLAPLMLRDQVLVDKAKVAAFDDLFQYVINDLVDIRKTAREMLDLWHAHEARVASGEIARYTNHIQIDESIDRALHKYVKSFVADAARVSKEFQKVARLFGVELKFLFQTDKEYAKGLAALQAIDPILASYVRASRIWLSGLRIFRDEVEHKNYVPTRMAYERTPQGGIVAREPQLLGAPITTSVPYIESRLNLFIEEILVWCSAKMLPPPMIITEIPRGSRDPNKVERFRVALLGSVPAWELTYSTAPFDDV